MRKYVNESELETVVCNKCKKVLKVENGILKEGCFHADYAFGYFSNRDGQEHSFDLCEECYDEVTAEFALPPMVQEKSELL